MERLFRLLLVRSFFKARPLSAQPKFDHIICLRRILRANFYDSLHVATFGADQASCNLEFFFVVDLNIKATCVLHSSVVLVIQSGARRVIGLRRWHRVLLRRGVEHILEVKVCLLGHKRIRLDL